MKVKELMTTGVAAVSQNDLLSDAARIMWECDCGAVPVLDSESKRVVGIITDRDICMAVWSRNQVPDSIRVSEVTSGELYACKQDDSVAAAENLMRNKQVRRIPVLDQNDKLIGILSLADIAKASRRSGPATTASELAPTEIVATLENICSRPQKPSIGATI